jgi:REP element-mobilizing transposase RayT
MHKPARKQGRNSHHDMNNLDDRGFEVFEQNPFPIAYLLTFRTYGSWLHGDERGSFGRLRRGGHNTKIIEPSVPLKELMEEKKSERSVTLDANQRELVAIAIREVCKHREYFLRAINVRTNHVHTVVSKAIGPEKIVNDFKAYSTRKLRENHYISHDQRFWSRGSSTRYLWKPRHVRQRSITSCIVRKTFHLNFVKKAKMVH